jgi:hypothetical protein
MLKPTDCICVLTNSFISNNEFVINRNTLVCESFSFVSVFVAFSCKKEMNMRYHVPAAGDCCS